MKVIDILVLTKLSNSRTQAKKDILGLGVKIQDIAVVNLDAEVIYLDAKYYLVQNLGM